MASHTPVGRNGNVSFWFAQTGLPEPRPPLPGDLDVDVAIVGAGFTGLWSAYYLKTLEPDLRIAIIEKNFAGFGASGRNGGWLSAELAASRDSYAARHGRGVVVDLLKELRSAIDEVIAVAGREGIEADIAKDGVMLVARNAAQRRRLAATYVDELSWGAGTDDFELLSSAEAAARIEVAGVQSALYSRHCARVQPAKLVVGLARVVERLGVRIYEGTAAESISSGRVGTTRGVVRAEVVLRCLEGFTATLKQSRRLWLPMNSSMIVTAPLSDGQRAAVGWHNAELLGDAAHAYFYAQRTDDGRLAIGGRGVPYRFGSRTDDDGETPRRTVDALHTLLEDLFPALRGIAVDHAWSGVLGVPRDWSTTVTFDGATGIGTAGGYAGSGLTTTNLAARTLVDLVLRRDTPLTRLPWAQRQARKWEPEPMRWLGVRGMYALYRRADDIEGQRTSTRTSALAVMADRITGR